MNESQKGGYKNPPELHRFKPGTSGNPSGRPKKINFSEVFFEELSDNVKIRDHNRQVEVSKGRAIIKSLIQQAVEGDLRAANTVLEFVRRIQGNEHSSLTNESTANDQLLIEKYLDRELRKRQNTFNPKD